MFYIDGPKITLTFYENQEYSGSEGGGEEIRSEGERNGKREGKNNGKEPVAPCTENFRVRGAILLLGLIVGSRAINSFILRSLHPLHETIFLAVTRFITGIIQHKIRLHPVYLAMKYLLL